MESKLIYKIDFVYKQISKHSLCTVLLPYIFAFLIFNSTLFFYRQSRLIQSNPAIQSRTHPRPSPSSTPPLELLGQIVPEIDPLPIAQAQPDPIQGHVKFTPLSSGASAFHLLASGPLGSVPCTDENPSSSQMELDGASGPPLNGKPLGTGLIPAPDRTNSMGGPLVEDTPIHSVASAVPRSPGLSTITGQRRRGSRGDPNNMATPASPLSSSSSSSCAHTSTGGVSQTNTNTLTPRSMAGEVATPGNNAVEEEELAKLREERDGLRTNIIEMRLVL
ncbi:unnamed protein product [Protopolystoma xenopodis]|uniref:Uncharacterized protein n=1 Tax=Protopolystoma xenopodis TaxID=117903 RepID=A0A3S5AAS5_9PLAT|nr:unnamed protein product [Protopolystoma xenopodis]